MTRITVLALPGTGHPHGGDGITEEFLKYLDIARFDYRIVPYPAEGFGIGRPYASSRDAGIAALDAAAQGLDRFAVAGYSQGAVAAGDFAEQWLMRHEDDPVQLKRLAGVALIADGRRPEGPATGTPGHPPAPGYGIAGQRMLSSVFFPVLYASAPGDPICALPAGNPLRTIADTIEWFSIRSTAEAIRWGAKLLDRAVNRDWQRWWNLAYWDDWDTAANFARGFLFDGRHTTDYVRFGHCRSLALAFNEVVN